MGDGLKLNGAAVGTTPYAIVDSGTSLLAGPTTDVKSIAASLSLSTTILSSKEYTVDCGATYTVVYTVEGSCDLQFGWNLPFRNDGDRRSCTTWTVVDLGRRVHAQVLREIRCRPEASRIRTECRSFL